MTVSTVSAAAMLPLLLLQYVAVTLVVVMVVVQPFAPPAKKTLVRLLARPPGRLLAFHSLSIRELTVFIPRVRPRPSVPPSSGCAAPAPLLPRRTRTDGRTDGRPIGVATTSRGGGNGGGNGWG